MWLLEIIVALICTQKVYCCPYLSSTTCKSYEEFLTQNRGVVAPGSDKTLRSLDVKYSKCGSSNIDIRELTIEKAQNYFQEGTLTSEQLTACYLTRIRYMNPYLKAVIEVNPDALTIARLADKRSGCLSGIQGIPILILDNIGTKDKMQTTVGAVALENVTPIEDSDVVKLIRAAGGVIIGKTNPSEWSGFRGDGLPGGWSGRGGQTLSPYVLIMDPGESSTGSAVAVAANLGLVALGTEKDHSLTAPTSIASLVGLKTTVGSVSVKGIILNVKTQFTVGPIARKVADAKILLRVISGQQQNYYRPTTRTSYRIGVARNPFWNQSDLVIGQNWSILESALQNLRSRPEVCIVDPVEGYEGNFNSVSAESENIVFLHETKYYVNQYLKNDVVHNEGKLGRSIQSLADIMKFNTENPAPEGYNQNYLIATEATDGLGNLDYRVRRIQNIVSARSYLNSILDRYHLDTLVAPCRSEYFVLLTSFGAIAGYPYITVPIGVNDDGIPVGICFLGRPNSESILLNIGKILEQVQNGRQVPKFILKPLTTQVGRVNNKVNSTIPRVTAEYPWALTKYLLKHEHIFSENDKYYPPSWLKSLIKW